MKREASLQRFLRKLKHKNFFNENEYDKLYHSGSAPARIYGTRKMYKFSSSDSLPKLHPIVSSIVTFNYNLARFLCNPLSPLVPNDYSCKDTIPLQETIDITINLIFNHNPNLNITKREFKKLFLFATSKTRFIFNSKFYNQIVNWLNEHNLNKPKFYLKMC